MNTGVEWSRIMPDELLKLLLLLDVSLQPESVTAGTLSYHIVPLHTCKHQMVTWTP